MPNMMNGLIHELTLIPTQRYTFPSFKSFEMLFVLHENALCRNCKALFNVVLNNSRRNSHPSVIVLKCLSELLEPWRDAAPYL